MHAVPHALDLCPAVSNDDKISRSDPNFVLWYVKGRWCDYYVGYTHTGD